MPRRRHKRLATVSLATMATLATFAGSGPAGAAPTAGTPPTQTPSTPQRAGEPVTVTLVTGDRVTVTPSSNGAPSVNVEPAPDREPGVVFDVRVTGEDIRVVPSDAGPLLAEGRLDEALFDIDRLIEDGLGDAHTTTTPLIVTQRGTAATRAADLDGAEAVRELPSIGGVALAADKAEPGRFWSEITGGTGRDAEGATTLAANAGTIWLDAPVRAALDRSVPQIGGDAAREAGLTGEGVTVAVLDTGIDTTHPDLDDAVTGERDFSGSSSGTADVAGHGTHVASILAGSGEASDGTHAGVAPDADLLNGKVLGDDGSGFTSQVIEGMEWATEQGADIVNMSLGGGLSSDGTDPMSTAVDRLTEETGTLFVVSAGNARLIEAPAAAAHALAVGSVDRQDRVSESSGRGPTLDGRLKPDLTAPGEGITAARAEGTGEAADGPYTALSGTSVASPHVAGAAALLQQRHPDWRADRLKGSLMNSALRTPGEAPYAQGAGRVDLTRALEQRVGAQPVSLTTLVPWPGGSAEEIVTYRNDTDEPITLTLSVTNSDGTPDSGEHVWFETPEVTVPAGGTTDVSLRMNGAHLDDQGWAGWLTATSGDGDVVIGTPITMQSERPGHDVTFDVVDRDGRPVTDFARLRPAPVLYSLERPNDVVDMQLVGGTWTAHVLAGSYQMLTGVVTPGADGAPDSLTYIVSPELTVDGNQEFTADAREGTPVNATVESPTATRAGSHLGHYTEHGQMGLLMHDGSAAPDLYAVPVTAEEYPLAFFYLQSFDEPADGDPGRPAGYDLAFSEQGRIPADLTYEVADEDLATVESRVHHGGDAELEGIWGRSAHLVPETEANPPVSFPEVSTGPAPSSTTRLLSARLADGSPVGWRSSSLLRLPDDEPGSASAGETMLTSEHYTAGEHHVIAWRKAAIGPAVFFAAHGTGQLILNLDGTVGSQPGTNTIGVGDEDGLTERITLRRDGQEVGSWDGDFVDPGVPNERADYELELTASSGSTLAPLATEVSARWSFSSAGPAEGEPGRHLPLPTLRIDGDFDLANRAPAGEPFALDLVVDGWQGIEPAPVESITLEASFDDGDTWRPLRVTAEGDGHTAGVAHPPGAEFVSLRAAVTTEDGTSLEQTVIRSYALAPR
ncbi:S8 family serine peptidase [Streptomyces marincola]|uniref:S8 family serine peptidase n=1 Tax=Streptomyces marincola TaxID=2878388 RepID=UPI001CF4E6D3|nr:S8 family serine peptidase [Streptomyces marincola]UCM90954.1 S8 family serine peptidase [Streptomyces marincola]